MTKLSKKKCSMCGKKLNPNNQVSSGENNFCDIFCLDWFKSTYENKKEERE